MGEHTPLGVVCGHVPRGAGCGVEVIMPMLVKGVVGVIYSVDQPIMEHLGRSCNREDTLRLMNSKGILFAGTQTDSMNSNASEATDKILMARTTANDDFCP